MNFAELFAWPSVLLSVAAVSGAQNTPVTATVTFLDNGRVQVALINNGRQPITGLTVVGEITPFSGGTAHSTWVRGIDAVIGPLDHPLMPKGTCTFVFNAPDAPDRARFEVSLKAAVFDDGSTFGEAEWIDRLILHRRYLYRHVDAALRFLSDVRRAPNSREQVVQSAEEFRDRELIGAVNREEQQVILHVFDAINLNLKLDQSRDWNSLAVADRLGVTVEQFTQLRQRLLASKPIVP